MPFLLEYGGLYQGLNNLAANVETKNVNVFAQKMIEFSEQCGKSTRNAAKPIAKQPCTNQDCTFDIAKASTDGRVNGYMRTHRFLDQQKFLYAAVKMKLELANAAIVSPRIAAGAKLGDLHYVYSQLVSILIADEH